MRGLYPQETDPSPVTNALRASVPPSPTRGEGKNPTRALIAPHFRHPASDRRRAGPTVPHARRTITPRCWWPLPAPARPRGCRWRCSMRHGSKARRSSCWSRAGSRPAPAPNAWRRRWASAPAIPSATACASARKCRAPPESRSSPKAFSRGRFSTIRNCPASPRCCSTNFTNARSMRISVSRWRAMRRWACARICASS